MVEFDTAGRILHLGRESLAIYAALGSRPAFPRHLDQSEKRRIINVDASLQAHMGLIMQYDLSDVLLPSPASNALCCLEAHRSPAVIFYGLHMDAWLQAWAGQLFRWSRAPTPMREWITGTVEYFRHLVAKKPDSGSMTLFSNVQPYNMIILRCKHLERERERGSKDYNCQYRAYWLYGSRVRYGEMEGADG